MSGTTKQKGAKDKEKEGLEGTPMAKEGKTKEPRRPKPDMGTKKEVERQKLEKNGRVIWWKWGSN